jgi:hypothetical protein
MPIDKKGLDAVKNVAEGNQLYNLSESDLIEMLEAYEAAKTDKPVSIADVRAKIRDLWLTHSNEEESLIKAVLDAAGVKYHD